TTVTEGLLPDLAPQGMVRQPFYLLGEAVGIEAFDGLHNPGVVGTPLLREQTAVGYLLRERVLKGVFELRKETRRIQKFGTLQVGQRTSQGLLGERCDGLQQRDGDVFADDCRGLQEGLLLGREPVYPGGEDRLDCGRYLNGPECLRQAIGPRLAYQDLA